MRRLKASASALLALSLSACGGGGGGGSSSGDAPVELRIGDAQAAESAGTLNFPVSLSRALGSALTLDVSSSDDSATGGQDFAPPAQQFTIPAGTTSIDLPVSVIADSIVENTETFTLSLANPSQSITLSDASASGSIDDDDQLTASVAAVNGLEADGGQLSFTVSLSAAAEKTVLIDYASSDDSATAGSDYSAASGQLSFPAGSTSLQIDIPLLDDLQVEGDETFQLTLSSDDSQVQISTASVIGTIEDDESLPLLLSLSGDSVAEDSGQLVFTATLNRITGEDQKVDYQTQPGSAVAGSDYSSQSGTLTIPAMQDTATISIALNGDSTLEADESFTLQLSKPQKLLQLSNSSATGTLENDDSVQLSLLDTSSSEGGTLSFTAKLSAAAEIPVSASFATSDGSAKAASDYTSASGTLSIPAGDTSAKIDVLTGADARLENDEQLSLSLSNPSSGLTLGGPASGSITNDDQLSLSVADVSTGEGNSGEHDLQFTLQLGGDSDIPLSLSYTTADGTAEVDSDYRASSGQVNFAVGDKQATISVPVLGDEKVENAETIKLLLSNASSGLQLPASAPLGTIDNDDGVTLSSLDLDGVEGDSGSKTWRFVLQLDKPADFPVSFDYVTADDTASAGSDYTALAAQTATIAAGDTEFTIEVTSSGDDLLEHDERFALQLSNPSNGLSLGRTEIGATLNNDDSVSLTLDDASTAESSGTPLRFAVKLDQAADFDLNFTVATADVTATTGEDYTAPAAQLSITAGDTAAEIQIDAIDDSTLEADETLTLSLTPVDGQTGVNAASATGTLTNDDQVTLSASIDPVSEADGTPLSVDFSLDQAAAVPVSVSYATASDSATQDDDFTDTNGTLEIAAGQTSASVEIPVTDDNRVEGSEQLELSFSSASAGVQIAASPINGVIDDDDSVSISLADKAADEASGELVFTATLSDSADIDLTIDFASANDSGANAASAGSDYTADSDTLTIPAGQKSGEIRIALDDDNLVERDETFSMTLSNPATGLTLGTASATGTISNDDSYSISVADSAGDEPNDNLEFVVSLSQTALDDLTLRYSSSDGSAEASLDYTAASARTATIAAGSDNATLKLPLIDDSDYEGDETVNLSVEQLAVADGSVESSASAIGTIRDDDTVEVSTSDVIVIEGVDANAIVTVEIAQPAVVSVDYNTKGITADAGDDYGIVNSTLTFSGGITSQTISIPIIDDSVVESNERFELRLRNPSANAKLVVPTAIITIDDNDAGELNDTGITLCAQADDTLLPCNDAGEGTDEYPGQDAENGRDRNNDDDSDGRAGFSFTKLDDNGDPLPASASSWDCVRDNVTGLTWEVKQANGLHDEGDTFSWYNSSSSKNGGDAGSRDGGQCDSSVSNCDTQGFVDAVNAADLCGFNDWRMPTVVELRSLADLSTNNLSMPAIDTDYFPRTDHGYSAESFNWRYWTGLPQNSSPVNGAWTVAFDDGHETPALKSADHHVRLVRD